MNRSDRRAAIAWAKRKGLTPILPENAPVGLDGTAETCGVCGRRFAHGEVHRLGWTAEGAPMRACHACAPKVLKTGAFKVVSCLDPETERRRKMLCAPAAGSA